MSTMEVVYSAEPGLRHPGRLLRAMVNDLVVSRELAWYLLRRNLRAQYRQSILGYFWILIQPLIATVVWLAVQASGVLNLGVGHIDYPIYLLVGTTLWQSFVEALSAPLSHLTSSKTMLSKLNFPRESLVLAGAGEVLVNLAARLALLAVVLVMFRVPVHPTALLSLVGVVALIAFGLTLGLLLVPMGLLYLDVQRGLVAITSLWFLITPIVYPQPTSGPLALIGSLNPATPLVVATRDWLLVGSTSHALGFVVVSALTCIGLLFAWVLYRVSMPHVIARMPAK
jgi:lipopolysaccharide transport system permease protein